MSATSFDESVHILIVEDSPTQAAQLKRLLGRHGFSVTHASDGLNALELLRRRRAALVISDIVMPHMDGFTLCRNIREARDLRDLPVILLTTLNDPEDVVRGLECGADNFITKPYDEEYLLSRVQFILAHKHLRRHKQTDIGIEVFFAGRKQIINADRLQILNLLLSTYETAVHKNHELERARKELRTLNEELSRLVSERTEELRANNEDLTALMQVTANAISTLNLDELLDVLLQRLIEVMKADTAVILLKENDHLRARASRGVEDEVHDSYSLPIGRGFAGTIAATMKPLYIEDAQTDPRVISPFIRQRGIRSMLGVPLRRNNNLVGVLHIDWLSIHPHREREVRLLEITAERCALAILNAQLHEALQVSYAAEQRGRALLEAALQMGKQVAATTDLRSCLLCTHECVRSGLGFDRVGVFLYDAEQQAFRGVFGTSRTGELVEERHVARNMELMQRAMREPGGLMFISDFTQQFAPSADSVMYGVGNHAVVALWAGEKPVGVLGVDNLLTQRLMTDEQLEALKLFAGYAGVAIENARLFEETRQLTEEVGQRERRRAAIMESALDCIITIDQEGRIIEFNPAAEKTFGYSCAAAVGEQMAELIIPPALREQHYRGLAHYLATDEGPVLNRRIELTAVRADGSEFPLELAIAPITTPQGVMFTGFMRDLTERNRAEEALRARDEEIRAMTQQLWQTAKLATMGELAASIAHELNNPLATVSLRVESLLGDAAADDPSRHALEVVEQEVERMANLIANLLQFSRRNAAQISTIDVRQELDNTVELIHYHLRKHNITVTRVFAEHVPMIQADRQQLRQLFLNLFTNASDAMSEGGTLTLRACVPPSLAHGTPTHIAIEIADTGAGIAPQDLARVTEPFFTTKEEGKGTGLGLSICKRIVEQRNGTFAIESEVGKGTRIKITLPVHNAGNSKALRAEISDA